MDTYYDLTPKVITAGCACDFTLSSRYEPVHLTAGRCFAVKLRSLDDFTEDVVLETAVDASGALSFTFRPKNMGEYQVLVSFSGDRPGVLVETAFFVVSRELAGLRPYKGDFHMHTHYSDGRESPAYMAAHARELGMDFAAITDHRRYDASLVAIDAALRHEMDILLFPGEEVNYDLGLGHIVSIGAERSVADAIGEKRGNWEEFAARIGNEVMEETKTLELQEGTNRGLFNYYYGIVKRIREAGGFAIAAHPFWISRGTYDLARKTWEQVLKERLFDAVEVFGDQGFEKNILSLARISEADAADIPLMGNSDAHNAHRHTMGAIYTIVFAEDLTSDSILAAIRGCRTVPCVVPPGSGETVAAGRTGLVEYTYFLMKEFFPRHDEICRTLGGLYKAGLRQGKPIPGVKVLQNELKQLYKTCFADE